MKPEKKKKAVGAAKLKQKGAPRIPARLTEEEVGEIFRYLEKLDGFDIEMEYEDRILRDGPSRDEYGELADLPAMKIINIADKIETAYMNEREGPFPEFEKLERAVAEQVLDAVSDGDWQLFEHLAKLVKNERERKDAHRGSEKASSSSDSRKTRKSVRNPLRLCDFVENRTRGRRLKPYNLKVVGPKAVYNCLSRRIMKIDGVHLIHRLARDEIRREIRKLQSQLGMEPPAGVSENNLSKIITSMGIKKFMDGENCKPRGKLALPYPEIMLPTSVEEPPLL